MRVVLSTEQILAVAFNIQVAEFHTQESLKRRAGFSALGPSLLAAEFDPSQCAARLLAHPEMEIGNALLSQSIVAGIGNVYKSEVCFACGVHPFRKVASLTPNEVSCLMATARKFMLSFSPEKWEICGEAADGHEAVSQTVELKPDVVLLDLSIPALSGIEVVKSLREKDSPATVVLMAAVLAMQAGHISSLR